MYEASGNDKEDAKEIQDDRGNVIGFMVYRNFFVTHLLFGLLEYHET